MLLVLRLLYLSAWWSNFVPSLVCIFEEHRVGFYVHQGYTLFYNIDLLLIGLEPTLNTDVSTCSPVTIYKMRKNWIMGKHTFGLAFSGTEAMGNILVFILVFHGQFTWCTQILLLLEVEEQDLPSPVWLCRYWRCVSPFGTGHCGLHSWLLLSNSSRIIFLFLLRILKKVFKVIGLIFLSLSIVFDISFTLEV